jgi:hypothetical protein
VARGGLAHHFAITRVKRGVQRKGVVAIVFKPMALQPSGRQRQHRIEPVQGLDRGLFIHAKHRRVLRRFDVQSDNVGCLGLEVGVVRGHVACDALGLKASAPPDPRHHHVADAQASSQLAAAPVGGSIGWRSAGARQYAGLQRRGSLVRQPSIMARVQARQPLSRKTAFPAADIIGVAAQQPAYRQVGLACVSSRISRARRTSSASSVRERS